MVNISLKIGGEAGFGIMTTGIFLGKIATRSGYYAFDYAEYPSLIRGGHNVVDVRISDEKVRSQETLTDILVCLNKETLVLHKDKLKDGGMVVFDPDEFDASEIKLSNNNISFVKVPFGKIMKEASLAKVMINNISLGAIVRIIGADFEILKALITETFLKKGEEIINKNVQAARSGFDYVEKNYPQGYRFKMPKLPEIKTKLFITGNEMIGLGAVAGNCRFYAAYPMTPSSALLHYLAKKSEKSGMVVKHAEDEISVMNMAIGASWAGARSMVGTSGGGYALMVEGTALAGITEIPIVVMMGQRPGPATGMPTWTEQGDLLFILHAGHGEFMKIILAPGDMEEAYKLTIEALNFADIYQTPVFIMADKYILEGHESIDEEIIKNHRFTLNRGKLLGKTELEKVTGYRRYALTDDGISPRALPGYKNSLHQANSYEHLEDGHTSEDGDERKKQVDKRNRKILTYLTNDVKMPVLYGDPKSPVTVVSWGSVKAPVLQAMKDTGNKFNYLHFSYLWPLPEEKLTVYLKEFKKLVLVENNSSAQFGQLLRMVTGVDIQDKLLKYNGRPFYPEEIIKFLKTWI